MRRLFVFGTIFMGLLVAFGVAGGGLQTAGPAEATETTVSWIFPTGSGGVQVPGDGPAETTGFAAAPCTNCYITQIVPDLVYMNDPDPANHPDGSPANYNNGSAHNIWLHHMVAVDACNLNRVFASGNERSTLTMPAGFGYFQGNCGWFVNYHIHNSSSATRGVAVKLVITYRTGETLKTLTPVNLSVSTAADAEYTIPEGYSDTHTGSGAAGIADDWTSTVQGKILGIGGHVHDYGISVSAYNNRLGDYMCTSLGGYGTGSRYLPSGGPGTTGHPAAGNALALDQAYHEAGGSPDNRYHIQDMTSCSPTSSQAVICVGDVIRLHTHYNNTSGFPVFDAMGIMVAYVDTSLPDANNNGTIDACDPADTDADGFSDSLESLIGTSAALDCGADAWPYDFDNDNKADLSDVLKYNVTGVFGSQEAPLPPVGSYSSRHDLNMDHSVDLSDVLKFNTTGVFGSTCTP